MNGYKFYLEFPDKKSKRTSGKENKGHSGNVAAMATGIEYTYVRNGGVLTEGLTPVYFTPNSPVCWSSVSWDYLKENCKRISEVKAREIHPALFERLDS